MKLFTKRLKVLIAYLSFVLVLFSCNQLAEFNSRDLSNFNFEDSFLIPNHYGVKLITKLEYETKDYFGDPIKYGDKQSKTVFEFDQNDRILSKIKFDNKDSLLESYSYDFTSTQNIDTILEVSDNNFLDRQLKIINYYDLGKTIKTFEYKDDTLWSKTESKFNQYDSLVSLVRYNKDGTFSNRWEYTYDENRNNIEIRWQYEHLGRDFSFRGSNLVTHIDELNYRNDTLIHKTSSYLGSDNVVNEYFFYEKNKNKEVIYNVNILGVFRETRTYNEYGLERYIKDCYAKSDYSTFFSPTNVPINNLKKLDYVNYYFLNLEYNQNGSKIIEESWNDEAALFGRKVSSPVQTLKYEYDSNENLIKLINEKSDSPIKSIKEFKYQYN